MSNNNNKQLGEAPWFHVIISTGLGTGFVPKAPGTVGAFLALLIWIGLYFVLSPICLFLVTLILIIGSMLLGVWTDNVMEKFWGEDPRAVVIDEFFGTWIAMLAAVFLDGPSYVVISLAIIGFILFRVIDITKPLGCLWIDRNIHGGWGCMLDDALAGFYAFVISIVVRQLHLIEIVHDIFLV